MLNELYKAFPKGNWMVSNTFVFNPSSWAKPKTEEPQKMIFRTWIPTYTIIKICEFLGMQFYLCANWTCKKMAGQN